MLTDLTVDKQALKEYCQARYILKLAFFGSILREDFSDDSDVDVLVEFEKSHVPGFLALARMERDLSELLGRTTDIRTQGDLSRYFRDEVVREAAVQYVA